MTEAKTEAQNEREAEIARALPGLKASDTVALVPATARYFTSASDTGMLLLGVFAEVSHDDTTTMYQWDNGKAWKVTTWTLQRLEDRSDALLMEETGDITAFLNRLDHANRNGGGVV